MRVCFLILRDVISYVHRVKKCSAEGRGAMSIDLDTLTRGLITTVHPMSGMHIDTTTTLTLTNGT